MGLFGWQSAIHQRLSWPVSNSIFCRPTNFVSVRPILIFFSTSVADFFSWKCCWIELLSIIIGTSADRLLCLNTLVVTVLNFHWLYIYRKYKCMASFIIMPLVLSLVSSYMKFILIQHKLCKFICIYRVSGISKRCMYDLD